MENEIRYPIQPFVFEFAKEASKNLNFSDISYKSPASIDVSALDSYLQNNKVFLDEFAKQTQKSNSEMNNTELCQIGQVFFDSNFDLHRAKIFNEVFPKGCLRHKLFAEQLLLQLDTVQSMLFHSSDNQALEFFRSFSTIHEMSHEISVLLPKVKNVRSELRELKTVSQSSRSIYDIKNQKKRLQSLQETMNEMYKVTKACPVAISLAENGNFEGAFSLISDMIQLMENGLIGIKSMRPHLQKLKETKALLIKRLKHSLHMIMVGESKDITNIVNCIHKEGLLSEAISESKLFINQYVAEQINKLLQDAADQKELSTTKLTSLSVRSLNEVLSLAFPNIRMRILSRSSDSTDALIQEFQSIGVDASGITSVSQIIADSVFKEVTRIVSTHPLNDAELEDFGGMFDSMISFGRGFEKYQIDKSVLQASLASFSRSFIESFHCSQNLRVTTSLIEEKWTKANPLPSHLELVKKLTTGKDITTLSINDDRYSCTTSLLVLLEVVWSYILAARRIRNSSDDIVAKLSETILLFNQQTYDLLLKAGSVQAGKLKSISTKNLALSAANLDLLTKLITFVKARLGVYGANQSILDSQLNNVIAQLTTHEELLLNKIGDVLVREVNKHFENAIFDDGKVSTFIGQITKEILTLNSFVRDSLPDIVVKKLFEHVSQQVVFGFEKLIRSQGNKIIPLLSRDIKSLNDQLEPASIVIRVHGVNN